MRVPRFRSKKIADHFCFAGRILRLAFTKLRITLRGVLGSPGTLVESGQSIPSFRIPRVHSDSFFKVGDGGLRITTGLIDFALGEVTDGAVRNTAGRKGQFPQHAVIVFRLQFE